MIGPPTACPDCGWVMPSNALPKHQRARHGDPRLSLVPSLEEQQRMVTLARKRLTQRQIAAETLWAASTVSRVLRLWGESRPKRNGHPPRLSGETVLETCQLYGMGYTVDQIADLLDLSPQAVKRRLTRGDVQMRPVGVAPVKSAARLGVTVDEYRALRKARRRRSPAKRTA